MMTRRIVTHLALWGLLVTGGLSICSCIAYRARRLAAKGRDRQALALLDKHLAFLPEVRAEIFAHLGRLDEAYDMAVLGLARKAGNRRRLVLMAARFGFETGRTLESMEWFDLALRSGYPLGRADRKRAWGLWVAAARRLLASSDISGALGALAGARRFVKKLPRDVLKAAITARMEELLRWSGFVRADEETQGLAARLGVSGDTTGALRGRPLDLAKQARRSGAGSLKALLRLCRNRLWGAAADAIEKGMPGLAGGCEKSCGPIALCGLEASRRLGRSGLDRLLSPLLRTALRRRSGEFVSGLRRLCLSAASLHAPSCSLLRRLAVQAGVGQKAACEAYLLTLGTHGGTDEQFARALWSQRNRRAGHPCGLVDGSWHLALGPVGPWSRPSWGVGGLSSRKYRDRRGRKETSPGIGSVAAARTTMPIPDGMVAMAKARLQGRFGTVIRLANSLAVAYRTDPLVRLELGRQALMMGRTGSALAHLHWAEALAQGPLHDQVARQVQQLEKTAHRLSEQGAGGHDSSDREPGQGGRPVRRQGPRWGARAPLAVEIVRQWARGDKDAMIALARTTARRALVWASSSSCRAGPGSAAFWAPRLLAALGRRQEAVTVLEAMVVRGASVCRWPWVWRTFRHLGFIREGAAMAARLSELFPRSEEVLLGKVALSSPGGSAAGQLADRDFRWFAADRKKAASKLARAWMRAQRCEDAGRALGFFLERFGTRSADSIEAAHVVAWFDAYCRRGRADRVSLPYDSLVTSGRRRLAVAVVAGLERGGATASLVLKMAARWPRLAFRAAMNSGSYREAAIQALRWRRAQPLSSEPLCALARVAVRMNRLARAEKLLGWADALGPRAACGPARVELELALGRWGSATRRLSSWLLERSGSSDMEDAVLLVGRWIDAGRRQSLVDVVSGLARRDLVGADRLVAALLSRLFPSSPVMSETKRRRMWLGGK